MFCDEQRRFILSFLFITKLKKMESNINQACLSYLESFKDLYSFCIAYESRYTYLTEQMNFTSKEYDLVTEETHTKCLDMWFKLFLEEVNSDTATAKKLFEFMKTKRNLVPWHKRKYCKKILHSRRNEICLKELETVKTADDAYSLCILCPQNSDSKSKAKILVNMLTERELTLIDNVEKAVIVLRRQNLNADLRKKVMILKTKFLLEKLEK